MELIQILFLFIGLFIGALLYYFYAKIKSSQIETKIINEYDIKIKQAEKQFREQESKNLIIAERLGFISKSEAEIKEDLKFQNSLRETAEKEISIAKTELKNLEKRLSEQKEYLLQMQEKLKADFKNLANDIMEEKSKRFVEQNKENLDTILKPLNEKIKDFERKVDETHKESIDYHAALRQQIVGLKEMNQQMSKETINLTKALKGDSKTQGNWGELILESVLTKSGLEKGREYEVEKSFDVDDENRQRLRPDVIINLPDNKKMVIDSKVSLTAYEKFVNAEDEKEKQSFLKEHISSIKRHVEQLGNKKYEDLHQIESPDFVLMFIPIEPAFAVAINADNQLYNSAFEKNIVIVTPATLLATLRTIDSMWNNEKQQRNAIEIARQAGALYDKFEGLMTDLTKIGKKMDDAKKDYSSAMNKLVDGKGNLISKVESIKKLGVKAKKSLPIKLLERANEKNDESK